MSAPNLPRGARVYRAMKESPSGGPCISPSARALGVRPGVDITIVGGCVGPGDGGLSVAPDTSANLPIHRRPTSLGGTGKDPVWELDVDAISGPLQFQQDRPTHRLIGPSRSMGIEDYEAALADTAPLWRKLP
jgi:hypothetical protein